MTVTIEQDLGDRLHICKNCHVPILKDKKKQRWVHIYRSPFNLRPSYIGVCLRPIIPDNPFNPSRAEPIRS